MIKLTNNVFAGAEGAAVSIGNGGHGLIQFDGSDVTIDNCLLMSRHEAVRTGILYQPGLVSFTVALFRRIFMGGIAVSSSPAPAPQSSTG